MSWSHRTPCIVKLILFITFRLVRRLTWAMILVSNHYPFRYLYYHLTISCMFLVKLKIYLCFFTDINIEYELRVLLMYVTIRDWTCHVKNVFANIQMDSPRRVSRYITSFKRCGKVTSQSSSSNLVQSSLILIDTVIIFRQRLMVTWPVWTLKSG